MLLIYIILSRPGNYEELYNLRHASLQNVIEWIFGVCKRCFWLMAAAAEYALPIQTKIPAAIAALHNFIRTWDPDDLATEDGDSDDNAADNGGNHPNIPITPENLGGHISAAEKTRASAKRDEIAKAMWADYIEEVQIRGNI